MNAFGKTNPAAGGPRNLAEKPGQGRFADVLPLLLLPLLAFLARNRVPDWVFMWLVAFSLYFGCKWLTWRRALRQNPDVTGFVSLGYLLGWVGMDANKFFEAKRNHPAPESGDWILACYRILLGVVLIWLVAWVFEKNHPLVTGWIGMVGIILCLHFGTFQLMALYWQTLGVNAPALMQQPLRSTSLGEFWGRRWNDAFHFLANDYVFRPLLSRGGPTIATLGAFLVSGLIHDFILSVPARGGYGLPTAYFMVQGFGVIFERTKLAKRIGLRSGWRGWLFMAGCTIGPVFWLFHPAFVKNVILPMLHAIGAT